MLDRDCNAWVADYSTDEGCHEAVERVNRLLKNGGISMRIEPPGLDDFLAQAAPVIAVDGRITSILVLPTRDRFAALLSARE